MVKLILNIVVCLLLINPLVTLAQDGGLTPTLNGENGINASIDENYYADELFEDLYDSEDEERVPPPLRNGLRNVFSNLRTPLNAINALLQLKLELAAAEVSRLLINSTLGIAGFFDVAKKYCAIEGKNEDFGQTLGYYGVGEGFYVVLPILGASTLRDGVALVPDGYADPLSWLVNYETNIVCKGIKGINRLSLDKDTYESVVAEQLDPYLFLRDAYVQNRRCNVND
ncbi:MAG: hypothetical protein B6I36_10445 [Desulfobacteraceae bacterium 4572_35.1]|nr:MAG: hypothetical protein B6I36_10445 [Desulfobacteraceae bacterium 4572_35.1]